MASAKSVGVDGAVPVARSGPAKSGPAGSGPAGSRSAVGVRQQLSLVCEAFPCAVWSRGHGVFVVASVKCQRNTGKYSAKPVHM